jgi:hypothetical protein
MLCLALDELYYFSASGMFCVTCGDDVTNDTIGIECTLVVLLVEIEVHDHGKIDSEQPRNMAPRFF